MRRKHEEKVFKSFLENKSENKKEKENKLFAIDMKWFNKWKTFVTNDMEESILSNNDKYISDNKLIGILPPGEIDNSKICIKDTDKYRLKPGMMVKKDYCAISQFLWEWLKLNYNGGPEIALKGINHNSDNDNDNDSDNTSDNLVKRMSDSVIVNNGSVIVIDSKDSFPDNQNPTLDPSEIRESINTINKIDAYKFNTKFNEFRIHNEQAKELFLNQKYKHLKTVDHSNFTFRNLNNK